MDSYENPITKWRVRGLVAGPSLPDGSLKLKSCRIKRITEQERRDLLYRANQRLMNPDMVAARYGYPDMFSAEMPLTTLVQSKHELSVTVEAPNELEAHRKAEEDADRYLGALAFAIGIQRYRFYPSVANKLPGAGGLDTRNYMSTGLAQVTLYEAEHLRTKDVDYAKTLLDLGGEDKVFARAFGFLQAAWRLRDVPLADPGISKAVLSNCFLVLEAVSDAVTKEWRKENRESTLSKQELIVDNLREKLNVAERASEKVGAVREAHKELQRAERYFQDLKLQTAGRILSVEERFIGLAKELANLRNRHLGHAGSTGAKKLDDWIYKSDDPRFSGDTGHFGKGELTAMAYLRAYATYVRGR